MSLRKKNTSSNKKSTHNSPGPPGVAGTGEKRGASPMLPSEQQATSSRARLLDLFSLIEKEFDSLHTENAARKLYISFYSAYCAHHNSLHIIYIVIYNHR